LRLIRHVLVRRLVAAVLVASLGGTLVPAAGAQGASLGSVLDDQAAIELALQAARAADAGSDRVVVFAEAYAQAVDGVSAEAVLRLLGQPSMSGVVPPAAEEARATASATAGAAASLIPYGTAAPAPSPLADALKVGPDGPPALRAAAPSTRPRAP